MTTYDPDSMIWCEIDGRFDRLDEGCPVCRARRNESIPMDDDEDSGEVTLPVWPFDISNGSCVEVTSHIILRCKMGAALQGTKDKP